MQFAKDSTQTHRDGLEQDCQQFHVIEADRRLQLVVERLDVREGHQIVTGTSQHVLIAVHNLQERK